MAQATYEDAGLIMRLYELRREETMRKARQWMAGKFSARTMAELNEQCPPGSEENAYFRMVTSYWEMAATFVTEGILDQGLFIRTSGEALFVWEKVRPLMGELRVAFKNPLFLNNLEAVATAQIAWMNENVPGAHEAFQERIGAK
jgi:hypothetical protein